METPHELGRTPHGDSQRCTVCHMSEEGGAATLFDHDVMALCQSCHDGQKASQEVHPVDVSAASVLEQMPQDFPLKEGRLTCLTCHDMARACQGKAVDTHFYLRGNVGTHRVEFCARCHDADQVRPFNVHDQRDGHDLKTDTCQWCHVGQLNMDTPGYENPVYPLRPYGAGLCENCHSVAADHPSGGPHVNTLPSEDMVWYMAANEMRAKMSLPFKDLLQYVKAAKRLPRTLPFNAQSRIACYTCHNPHEKGVIRATDPRSLGAEPKKPENHRLRASKKGQMCQACHNK